MTDRRVAQTVGTNVVAAIEAATTSLQSVAEATDLTLDELEQRLQGVRAFSVRELVKVGGFLHFPPSRFLQGVNA